jgi:hypothetical protein
MKFMMDQLSLSRVAASPKLCNRNHICEIAHLHSTEPYEAFFEMEIEILLRCKFFGCKEEDGEERKYKLHQSLKVCEMKKIFSNFSFLFESQFNCDAQQQQQQKAFALKNVFK